MRIYGECTPEREKPVRTIYSKTLIVSEKEEGSWVAAGTQSRSNLVSLHLKIKKNVDGIHLEVMYTSIFKAVDYSS